MTSGIVSCSDCTWHDNKKEWCHTMDLTTKGLDGCNCHETYEEMITRIETTQMRCDNPDQHGLEYFSNSYSYCPYCGKKLEVPVFKYDTSKVENDF